MYANLLCCLAPGPTWLTAPSTHRYAALQAVSRRETSGRESSRREISTAANKHENSTSSFEWLMQNEIRVPRASLSQTWFHTKRAPLE